jgi:hypothetical protein
MNVQMFNVPKRHLAGGSTGGMRRYVRTCEDLLRQPSEGVNHFTT